MKRAGFTMIELIFVIVILGILAAVALPKFAGVSDQANAQKCNAFVGTLNRTVGPSMWSASIANDLNGDITSFAYDGGNDFEDIETYIALEDLPIECYSTLTVAPAAASTFILHASGPYIAGAGTPVGTPQFGTSLYSFDHNASGDASTSPIWSWNKLP